MARKMPSAREFDRDIRTAAEEEFSRDVLMDEAIAAAAENPITPREEHNYLELVALHRSLDGPEHSMRTLGYSRAVFPTPSTKREFSEK
jgi:hypothetical protein